MKFHHKIMLAPLVTGLAFLLMFGMTSRASRRGEVVITRIQDEFFHALELSHDLETDLLRIRHLLTEAVTNTNEDQVTEANAYARRFRETVNGCSGVPTLAATLGPLLVDFDIYYDLALDTTGRMLEPGQAAALDFSPDLLNDIVLMNQRYESLRIRMAQVVANNNTQLSGAIAETRDRLARLRHTMNVTSVVFLVLLVAISMAVIASVVRPINRMSRMALAISGGDLGKELHYYARDSLGRLADSFRQMQSSLIRDIARREEAEADLISAQGQIIQSEKMAVLGKLVAGLAHELNTPLGALNSSVDVVGRSRDIIRESLGPQGNMVAGERDVRFQRALKAMDQGLANVDTASTRIQSLVQGLKNFSQLDKAEFQLTDLNAGLTATLDLLQHEIPEQVEVQFKPGALEPVPGFPAQLNQLFLGLIRRAIVDTGPPGKVVVETAQEPGLVRVLISDTGRGYDDAELNMLFNPSFRSDQARVQMDWGLATCNRIVDRHQGTLKVNSASGEGTTYIVDLPTGAIPSD